MKCTGLGCLAESGDIAVNSLALLLSGLAKIVHFKRGTCFGSEMSSQSINRPFVDGDLRSSISNGQCIVDFIQIGASTVEEERLCAMSIGNVECNHEPFETRQPFCPARPGVGLVDVEFGEATDRFEGHRAFRTCRNCSTSSSPDNVSSCAPTSIYFMN